MPKPRLEHVLSMLLVGACSNLLALTGCSALLDSSEAHFVDAETLADDPRAQPDWMRRMLPPLPQLRGYFGAFPVLYADALLLAAPGQTFSGDANYGKVFRYEVPNARAEPLAFELTQELSVADGTADQGVFEYAGFPEPDLQYSMAMEGDTLVIGVAADKKCGGINGAVHVFEREPHGYVERQVLRPATCGAWRFGRSVLLIDDELIVGAVGDDSTIATEGNTQTGRVFIYRRGTAAKFALFQELQMEPKIDGAFFGFSIAGDHDRLAIGATFVRNALLEDHTATDPSTVYVYRRSSGKYADPDSLRSPLGAAAQDAFGWSIAVQGDTIAVGAPFDRSASANDPTSTGELRSGAVYVYQGGRTTRLKAERIERESWYGWSVALADERLLVGSPNASDRPATLLTGSSTDAAESQSGIVYLYERARPDAAFKVRATFEAPDRKQQMTARFGTYITLNTSVAAIAAPFKGSPSSGIARAGAAYLIDLTRLPPLPTE